MDLHMSKVRIRKKFMDDPWNCDEWNEEKYVEKTVVAREFRTQATVQLLYCSQMAWQSVAAQVTREIGYLRRFFTVMHAQNLFWMP